MPNSAPVVLGKKNGPINSRSEIRRFPILTRQEEYRLAKCHSPKIGACNAK
jgi:hypothetical protein